MRSPFSILLILVLTLLVGVQSTASAMGSRCSKTKMSAPEVVGGMHHDMSTMGAHDMASMDHGPMSHAEQAAHPDAASDDVDLGGLICKCGPGCDMTSCFGSSPVVITLTVGDVQVAPPEHERFEIAFRLRDAHGLDLIRPPSKS